MEPTIQQMEQEIAPLSPSFNSRWVPGLAIAQAEMRKRQRIAARREGYEHRPAAKPNRRFTDDEENFIEAMLDSGIPLHAAVRAFAAHYALAAYKRANGNGCKAARIAGAHRNTIERLIPKAIRQANKKRRAA